VSPNAGNDSSTAPAHIKHDFNIGLLLACRPFFGDFVIRIRATHSIADSRVDNTVERLWPQFRLRRSWAHGCNRAFAGSLTPAG
ncbi:MAG TPA: hypothetical protein VN750_26290, partial [Steroidobacteraceae bacterium]|nr:hypothetical protein [Steroidobacteraceae bacterium]